MAARSNGGLAQLGEHLPCKQGVESSNLLVSTVYQMIHELYLENRIPINLISNNDKTSEGYLGKLRYTEKEKSRYENTCKH